MPSVYDVLSTCNMFTAMGCPHIHVHGTYLFHLCLKCTVITVYDAVL